MTGVQRFRKRPVVIEAMQWLGREEDRQPMREFLNADGFRMVLHLSGQHGENLVIETLEGQMTASPRWWIIRGVKGEFYPCEPEIFELTYVELDS